MKNSITKLRTFVQELKQRIKTLENDNTKFETANKVLSKNITSLFKTASEEIQRKDKIIDELRKRYVSNIVLYFLLRNHNIDCS